MGYEQCWWGVVPFMFVVMERKFVVTKTNMSDDLRDRETKGQKN